MTHYRGNWDTGQRRNFRRILVVGGGRAGVAAAEELRRQGFGGEVVVMCDEPDAPYDRPSCSKGLLTGHKRPRDARMPVQEDLAIQWEMGRSAVHLDPENRVVTADNDQEYRYDGLVIATGAAPVWPKGWPQGEPGLHQLYGLQHAWDLRRSLQRAKRVAVVGGGLTGCEVACSVRKMARHCTLIDSKQQVMAKALGEVVGRYVTEEIADDGVELRLGRRVREIERTRRGWVLVLDDSSEVYADVVVATVGDRPDTRWLESTGFDISDGVLCDEHLRVVGGEDIVAAGTVARWPNLRYSPEPRRVGQWIMALEQGRAAAAALLRSDHPSRPAALVPRYWSDQFGLRIQVCGEVPTDSSAEMTVSRQRPGRRDTARAGVLVGYHRDGEQIGLVGVNALRAFTTTARMMLAAPPKFLQPTRPQLEPARAVPRRELAYQEQPMLPPAQPRMIAAAPAPQPPPAYEPGYQPQYGPEPAYGPEPQYAGMAPPYEPAPQYGMQPQYGVEPQYGPEPRYDEPGPQVPLQYDPSRYGPAPVSPAVGAPRERFAAEAPPEPSYPPPGYGPDYGYAPPPPEYTYAPEYAYAAPPDPGYPPPEYSPAPAPGYGQPGYGPGAAPPGYGYPPPPDHGYAGPPPPDYGPPAPGYGYPPPGYEAGPPPGYEPGPPPGYGYPPPPDYAPPAPTGPTSPAPSRSPRDRFATDEFAAVR